MRKVLSVVLLVGLFAVPCLAAESGVNVSMEKGEDNEAAQAITNVDLAERLAALGREQKSPLLLASAAQILSSAGTFAEEAQEKTQEDGKPATEETKERAAIQNTPESLYAEAVAAAKEQGDAALAGIIENQSRVGGSRGVVGGAKTNRTRVYGRDYYDLRFHGGRRAAISVSGDGDDVELYVYDANGNLIVSDANGYRTYRSVSWTPRWTGAFRIFVVNPNGRVPYVDYRMITN
jgi:hypothetical protein